MQTNSFSATHSVHFVLDLKLHNTVSEHGESTSELHSPTNWGTWKRRDFEFKSQCTLLTPLFLDSGWNENLMVQIFFSTLVNFLALTENTYCRKKCNPMIVFVLFFQLIGPSCVGICWKRFAYQFVFKGIFTPRMTRHHVFCTRSTHLANLFKL